MPTGFGGSPGLALIGGVARGLNQKRLEEREARRNAILTRLKKDRVNQAQERISLERRQQQRLEEAERRRSQAWQQEQDDREAAIAQMSDRISSENPDLSESQVRLRARAYLNRGTTPRQEGLQERSSEALATSRESLARQRNTEVETQQQTTELLGDDEPAMRNIRTALRNVSNQRELNEVRELANSQGVNPVAFRAAASEIVGEGVTGGGRDEGDVRGAQREALRAQAKSEAQRLVEELGSVESAINAVSEKVLGGEFQDAEPEVLAFQEEVLKALDDLSQDNSNDPGAQIQSMAEDMSQDQEEGGNE